MAHFENAPFQRQTAMTFSRVLVLIVAVSLSATPAAAQGRTTGKLAGVGKPSGAPRKASAGQKASDSVVRGKSGEDHGKSADAGKDATSNNVGSRGDMTIAERIAANPQQKARIEAMLTGTGLTLEQAADGFRNAGQFIAAVEASKNQSIPFGSLKSEMTGENALSLGEALDKLKPTTSTPPNP
jgi:hypothetical protein